MPRPESGAGLGPKSTFKQTSFNSTMWLLVNEKKKSYKNKVHSSSSDLAIIVNTRSSQDLELLSICCS
jgi:hypothetical protein